MMAAKLRFSRGLKAKAPGAVTACGPLRSRSSKFLQARAVDHDWHKKQRWGRWRFFFFYLRGSFKCMIVILPTFWHSAPAWDFSWQLTRNVSLATMLVHSYRRSLDEGYGQGKFSSVHFLLWVETSRSSFTAEVWSFSPPGAPVTSFLSQQISTVIRSPRFQQDETSWALSSIAVVTKAIKRTARTSLSQLGTATTLFPAIRTKTARSIGELFSQWKILAQKSKQRSTNWRRRHLGDMQQQPRRWPGFDKCVETKLRWDVYIRPWPPGWSFWRRIYTSRGSETQINSRVNEIVTISGTFSKLKLGATDTV